MPNAAPLIATRRYQCRHVFTDGHRCGSPCLKGPSGPEDFCYYHHRTRRPLARRSHDPYNEPPNQTSFSLPTPEDHSSIQLAIGEIMNGLAGNALDPRRAGLLLYALQIASGNLATAPQHATDDIVHDITFDPTEGPLAPINEVPGDRRYREIMEAIEQEGDDEDDEEEDEDDEDDDEDDDYYS